VKSAIRSAALALALIGLLVNAAAAAYQPIMLRGYTFDPLEGVPQVPASLRAPAPAPSQPAYYLVQCTGPIQVAWKASLTTRGADLLGYAPQYAFAVRMTPQEAADVAGLSFVRWVGAYQPAYELSPTLPPEDSVTVSVVLWPGEASAPVEQALGALGATILVTAPGATWPVIRAQVAAGDFDAIAAIPAVSWVEEWRPPQPLNDVAQRLINVSPPDPGVAGAFDVWNTLNLFGSGHLVAVADTGLDTGDLASLLLDFQGRVQEGISYVSDAGWEDPYGHGTHCAGSVLGDGTNSGSNPLAHQYTGWLAGMAPEAELVVQRIFDASGSWGDLMPSDLNEVFQWAYDRGARIHSDSWGADIPEYTLDARQTDEFVWAHRDMTILVANGNAGPSTGTVGTPATAKNCISVGASESVRNTPWWDPPGGADNPNGMADFSSRGPTDDGRTKPDITAPGTYIVSCTSQLVNSSDPYDPFYQYMSGTSMATPLTAGAATLVRDYMTTIQGRADPSAALIKAALINSATEMAPGQYLDKINTPEQEITERPNNAEGWGRVDVGSITYTTQGERGIYQREGTSRGIYFTDVSETYGLGTGEHRDYWFSVVDGTHPFRASLAWTDYPGMLGAGKALVNDMDLEVRGPMPDGPDSTILTTWLGSGEHPAETTRMGATPDRANNVEGVDINAPAPGWYRVRVIGYNVPEGPQPYALVVSAPLVTTYSISGAVTDADGWGVGGVAIEVHSLTSGQAVASTTTESSYSLETGLFPGDWRLDGLSPGFYEVRPVPPNLHTVYAPTKQDITIGAENLYGINFEAVASYSIRARVVTPGGRAIPDVRVTAYDTSSLMERGRGTTNSDGYCEIQGLPAGWYDVVASKTGVGFDPEEGWTVVLPNGSIPYVSVDFVGGVPYPTYYIWGHVRRPDGIGVADATLTITGGGQYRGAPVSRTATTRPDGYYAVGGLPRGTYRIDGEKVGYGVHPILSNGKPAVAVSHVYTSVFLSGSQVNWQATARDLALTSAAIDTGVLMAGRPASMTVEVANLSREAETDVTVNVSYWNGESADSQTIPLLPGNTSETLTFAFTPPRAGPGTIHIALAPIAGEVNTGNNACTLSVQVQGMGLSDGYVTPETGTETTLFEWRVLYTHPDDVAPDQMWLAMWLGGSTGPSWVPMSALDAGDTDYTDGRWYTSLTWWQLPEGTGAYRFAAKVEDEWIYWPQPTGAYRSGPVVYPEN